VARQAVTSFPGTEICALESPPCAGFLHAGEPEITTKPAFQARFSQNLSFGIFAGSLADFRASNSLFIRELTGNFARFEEAFVIGGQSETKACCGLRQIQKEIRSKNNREF
jgi:hypothetical protein